MKPIYTPTARQNCTFQIRKTPEPIVPSFTPHMPRYPWRKKWVEPIQLWFQKTLLSPKNARQQKTLQRHRGITSPTTTGKSVLSTPMAWMSAIAQKGQRHSSSSPFMLQPYQVNLMFVAFFCLLLTIAYVFFQFGRLIGLLEIILFGVDDIVRSLVKYLLWR